MSEAVLAAVTCPARVVDGVTLRASAGVEQLANVDIRYDALENMDGRTCIRPLSGSTFE